VGWDLRFSLFLCFSVSNAGAIVRWLAAACLFSVRCLSHLLLSLCAITHHVLSVRARAFIVFGLFVSDLYLYIEIILFVLVVFCC
jgi:hypothetical protein